MLPGVSLSYVKIGITPNKTNVSMCFLFLLHRPKTGYPWRTHSILLTDWLCLHPVLEFIHENFHRRARFRGHPPLFEVLFGKPKGRPPFRGFHICKLTHMSLQADPTHSAPQDDKWGQQFNRLHVHNLSRVKNRSFHRQMSSSQPGQNDVT